MRRDASVEMEAFCTVASEGRVEAAVNPPPLSSAPACDHSILSKALPHRTDSMEAPRKPALPPVASIFDGLTIDADRKKHAPMRNPRAAASVGAPYELPDDIVKDPGLASKPLLEEQFEHIANGVPFRSVAVLGAPVGSFIRGISPNDIGWDMVLDAKVSDEEKDYVTSRSPVVRIERASRAPGMNRLGLLDVLDMHQMKRHAEAREALQSLVTVFTPQKGIQVSALTCNDVVMEVVNHDLLPVRLERLLALIEYNRIPGIIVRNTKYEDAMAEAAQQSKPVPMIRRFYIPTVQDMLVALWGPDTGNKPMKLGRGASWSKGEYATAQYNGREGLQPWESPLQESMTEDEEETILQRIKTFQMVVDGTARYPDSAVGPDSSTQFPLPMHGPFGYITPEQREAHDAHGLAKRLLVHKYTLTASEAASANEDRAWRRSATSMLYPELSGDNLDHVAFVHRTVVRGTPPTLADGEPFGSDKYTPAGLELEEAVLSTPVGAWMADSTTDPVLEKHLDLTRFDIVRDRWRLAQLQRMVGTEATFDLTVADLREVAALGHAYEEYVASEVAKSGKDTALAGEAMRTAQMEIRTNSLVDQSHIGCALRAMTTWGSLHFGTSYASTHSMKDDATPKEPTNWKEVKDFANMAPKVPVPKILGVGSHGCNSTQSASGEWVPLPNDHETTLHWRITEVGNNAVWATYSDIEESLAPYFGNGDAEIPAYKLAQLLQLGKYAVEEQTDASDEAPKFYGLTNAAFTKLKEYLPGTFGDRSSQWVPETGDRDTEDLTSTPSDIHCVPTVKPFSVFTAGSTQPESLTSPDEPMPGSLGGEEMDQDDPDNSPMMMAGADSPKLAVLSVSVDPKPVTKKVRMLVPKGILLFTRTQLDAAQKRVYHHGGVDPASGFADYKFLIGELDSVDMKSLAPPYDVGMTLKNGARAIRQANGNVTSHEASAPVFEFPLPEKGRLSDKEKNGMPVAATVEKLMEAAIHYVIYHGGNWNGGPLARSVFPNYAEELYEPGQESALRDALVGKAKDIVKMLTQMNSLQKLTENSSSAVGMEAASTEGLLPDSRVRIGAGFLKSLMQKAVRIGAKSWKFWGDDYVPSGMSGEPLPPCLEDMDAALLAMAAFGLCCSHLGDAKLPELQMKSVPGPSAAFKRLAIIMVEDAWPVALPTRWLERGYDTSYWLNCFASHALLLSAPQRKYHTSLDTMVSAMIVVASAASSPYHVAHELDGATKAFDKPKTAIRMNGFSEAQVKAMAKDSLAYHINCVPSDYMRIASNRGKGNALSDAMFMLMMGDAAQEGNGMLPADGQLKFDYRTATVRAVDEPPDATEFVVNFDKPVRFDFVVDVSVGYMHSAAAMIRVIRSFGGDMDMMDRAASFGDPSAYPTGLLVRKILEATGVEHFQNGGALTNATHLMNLASGTEPANPDLETQAYPKWRYAGGERAQIRCAFSPLDLEFPHPNPYRVAAPDKPAGFYIWGDPGLGRYTNMRKPNVDPNKSENYHPLTSVFMDSHKLAYDFRRVENVPMLHMIDQHAYPGVAHLWTTWPEWLQDVWPQDGFRSRFKFLFNTVTGWNPRCRSHALQEPKELVEAPTQADWPYMDDFQKHSSKVLFARAAQKIVLASQRQLPRMDVLGWKTAQEKKVTLRFPVDHGVLAGGVGVVGKLKVRKASENSNETVQNTTYFFRIVAYKGDTAPTKPTDAIFVQESSAEFSQIGLPPDQFTLEYKLSVSVGMDSPEPVVLDFVSSSTRGAKPKLFTITKKVREAAVEAFYQGSAIEGYPFASEAFPKFRRAHFVTNEQSMQAGVTLQPGWYLTTAQKPHPMFLKAFNEHDLQKGAVIKQWTYFDSATGRQEWCYDCHVATLDVALTPPLEVTLPTFSDRFKGSEDPNDAVVSTYLRRERNVHMLNGMPTMCNGYEESIREVCLGLWKAANKQVPGGRVVLERLRSFLDRAITEIAMPVPTVTGGRAADSLEAVPGDWLVWRGLMYISLYATGAFVCKQIPKFEVKSRLLMREVIRVVDAAIEEVSEHAQLTGNAEWKTVLDVMETRFGLPVPPAGETTYPEPTEVQRLAVGGLLRRDGVPLVDTAKVQWPQPLVKPRPPVQSPAELPPPLRAHFLAMDTVRIHPFRTLKPESEHDEPCTLAYVPVCVAGHGQDGRGHLLRAQVALAHGGRAAHPLGVPQGHCREHQGRACQVGPRRVRAHCQAGQVHVDHGPPLQHCHARGLFQRQEWRAPDDALREGVLDVLHL